jgi:hypothetical protein
MLSQSAKEFVQSVVLPPVPNGMYQDTSLEPQVIMSRATNQGTIIIDSKDRNFDQPPNDFAINKQMGYRYKRLAFYKLCMFYNTPNVNPINNSVQFNVGGTIYTATIPQGQYSFTTLATALQTALNAAGSGATFTVTTNITNNYTITSTVAYFFIVTSAMVKNGISLIALPQSQTPTTSKNTGQVMLLYSKSMYVISPSFSQYTKNPSYFSGTGQMSFVGSYCFTDSNYVTGTGVLPGIFVSSDSAIPPRFMNYESTQTLTSITVQLLDDYGNLFYIPDYQNDGSPNPTNIVLTFITEI